MASASLAAAVLAIGVHHAGGPSTTWLYVIGVGFGVVLFHSRFGFTSAWRQLVTVGQGRAVRAHMLMLAVACVLFAPLLAAGRGSGNVYPIGAGLVVGAVLFGVGMQLGGSCASGTLFAVGSGQTVIVFTLVGFVMGSVVGAWHYAFWIGHLPGRGVSLADSRLGYPGALAVSLLVMAAIVGITLRCERRRRPPIISPPPVVSGAARAVRGSWPLWVGAILLAALNALTLAVSHKPWGITSAFALWGSKALHGFGVNVGHWAYWSTPEHAKTLARPILADRTSVMDLGIIAGALAASAAGGVFVLHRRIPARTALAATVGGLFMGYGARLANGCNIGAYFSGVASFSLAGWAWGALAMVGTVAGVSLRPIFGLTNPKPGDAVC
ncbi:MAG TPA: YeeE/YedE family protein [Acidimicrobiia bacterium]|nr:YeeE/YedE family protein [Acidimicrobiia bacterium]